LLRGDETAFLRLEIVRPPRNWRVWRVEWSNMV